MTRMTSSAPPASGGNSVPVELAVEVGENVNAHDVGSMSIASPVWPALSLRCSE